MRVHRTLSSAQVQSNTRSGRQSKEPDHVKKRVIRVNFQADNLTHEIGDSDTQNDSGQTSPNEALPGFLGTQLAESDSNIA